MSALLSKSSSPLRSDDHCYRITKAYVDDWGFKWYEFERKSDGAQWDVYGPWFWTGEKLPEDAL
jgi:hypothetical protein